MQKSGVCRTFVLSEKMSKAKGPKTIQKIEKRVKSALPAVAGALPLAKPFDRLYDYIGWMGDLSYEAYPFNELDALVLSLLSYYDFSQAFPDAVKIKTVRLGDCAWRIESEPLPIRITGADMGYNAVLEQAVKSKRFGDLEITNIVDILDPSVPLQFAAMVFRCPEFNFLALRGTDSSLAGWKEDFMIAFIRTTAQELAQVYCEQHIEDGKANYIGGHSKGGNLALYAACHLSDAALDSLTRVFIFDGPGLCPEVLDPELIWRIEAKATRIIPEFDIIGKLFEPAITDTRIVKSSAVGFAQHSIGTWYVDHGKLALAEENDPYSVELSKLIGNWIDGMDYEGRVRFTEDVFDVLGANGALMLEDLKAEDLLRLVGHLTKTKTLKEMAAVEQHLRSRITKN